jgi:hypothetical protein
MIDYDYKIGIISRDRNVIRFCLNYRTKMIKIFFFF